jgi:hypothetical protein
MPRRARFCAFLALLATLAFIPSSESQDASQDSAMAGSQESHNQKKSVVYVCACLKNKSCSCMTEAKMKGPCACGTEGGPPMKEVPSDSGWAKENRDALAK